MTERFHEQERLSGEEHAAAFPSHAGRRLRMVREPAFTGLEAAAYVVILIMVCGPLALGAFGL